MQIRNARGESCLHHCSWNGHLEIVQFLLQNGADPNSISPNGFTPLHIAAWGGWKRVAKALIESGIVKLYSNGFEQISYCTSCSNFILPSLDLSLSLSLTGAWLNFASNTHITPLLWSLQSQKQSMALLLVSFGARLKDSTEGISLDKETEEEKRKLLDCIEDQGIKTNEWAAG